MNLFQSAIERVPASLLPQERGELLDVAWTLGVAGVLALVGFALAFVLSFLIRRVVRRTRGPEDAALLVLMRRPLRGIVVAAALLWTDDIVPGDGDAAELVVAAAAMAMPLMWGWLAICAIGAGRRYVQIHADLESSDNLEARRRRTRADLLARVATVVVGIMAVGLALLQIPAVREVGLALVASAGLAGLAVGVAAQPLLKNLVGGMQLAFTEPVRIDDVIVYKGEWGRVETITLTYVVLKIWDDRRLVVPVSKLVEEPIENWTRKTSHLLGTVMIYCDHAVDVERLRNKALAVVRGHKLWDGRAAAVQVTDMTAFALEVRVLMSGRNGSELFEMRCDVREAVVGWLAREMPESLNRNRVMLEPAEAA